MTPIIVFFISLLAVAFLVGFKVFELKKGIKPFSATRYRADTYLKKKADIVVGYIRYANWQTVRLLALFLFGEGRALMFKLFEKIEGSNLGAMVKGTDTPKSNGAGTNSTFLKEVATFKREEKESLK